MQVLASQLHFLANKNAQLAIPPLFWPVNCIKIGGHVALLSDPTVCTLYCDIGNSLQAYTLAFPIQCILLDRYQNANPLAFKFNFINLDYHTTFMFDSHQIKRPIIFVVLIKTTNKFRDCLFRDMKV